MFHKFTKGQKVVPISKSVSRSLEDSIVWKEAKNSNQPFLFVSYYEEEFDRYICSNISGIKDGDYFKEHDLVLYEEFTSESKSVSYKEIVTDTLKKYS